MSDLPIFPSRPHPNDEELVLVGFRLDPSHDGPQFYTLLVVGGDNERPVMADGRILFFTAPALAAKVLDLDPTFEALGPAPRQVEAFCDVAEALHLVNSQDADPDGVVLESLLLFDDLVRATELHIPEQHREVLTELATRLAEGALLKDVVAGPSRREHAEDALLWCIGAIAIKSRMIA